MKNIFITGGAGFIGSNLCGFLLGRGHIVTAYDNLILGRKKFLHGYLDNPRFKFIEADLIDEERLIEEIGGHHIVFHMAANSDISQGARQTDVDLNTGTIATHRVVEAMRKGGVGEIVFASPFAIYGDKPRVVPTPEDYGPLFPISFYGASKLACEALISAFCYNHGIRAWIYRFANIIGRNGTHGAPFDFVTRLKKIQRFSRSLAMATRRSPTCMFLTASRGCGSATGMHTSY